MATLSPGSSRAHSRRSSASTAPLVKVNIGIQDSQVVVNPAAAPTSASRRFNRRIAVQTRRWSARLLIEIACLRFARRAGSGIAAGDILQRRRGIATFKRQGRVLCGFNGGTITPLADSQARGHQSLIGGSDGIAVNRQLSPPARGPAVASSPGLSTPLCTRWRMLSKISLAVFPTIIIDL